MRNLNIDTYETIDDLVNFVVASDMNTSKIIMYEYIIQFMHIDVLFALRSKTNNPSGHDLQLIDAAIKLRQTTHTDSGEWEYIVDTILKIYNDRKN